MKRKKCYETPLITQAQVELEDGLCAGSVNENNDSQVTIKKQSGSETSDGGTWGDADTETWGEWE